MARMPDREANLAIERKAKASRKASPVRAAALYALAPRHNTTPKGYIVQRSIKSKRQVGDKQLVFGTEPIEPSFQGGEGGNGWTVPSTTAN